MHAAILTDRCVENDFFKNLEHKLLQTLHSVFTKQYHHSVKKRGSTEIITRKYGFDKTKIIKKGNAQTVLINRKKVENHRFEWKTQDGRTKAKVSRINAHTIKMCVFKYCSIAGHRAWHVMSEITAEICGGEVKPIEIILPKNMKHLSQKISSYSVKVIRIKKKIILQCHSLYRSLFKAGNNKISQHQKITDQTKNLQRRRYKQNTLT